MAAVAVGREPHGAAVDRLADQPRHLALLFGCRVLLDPALAHDEVAQRAVTDHARDIDAGAEPFDGVQVAAVVHPVPRQAREDRLARDVLDGLHHAGEEFAVLGSAGREGDAAVADQGGRDTVTRDRRDMRIPADLRVEVRMQVDEAGRDGHPFGVDFAPALGVHLADGGYRTAIYGDVGGRGLPAQAVDDLASADHDLMRHAAALHALFDPIVARSNQAVGLNLQDERVDTQDDQCDRAEQDNELGVCPPCSVELEVA